MRWNLVYCCMLLEKKVIKLIVLEYYICLYDKIYIYFIKLENKFDWWFCWKFMSVFIGEKIFRYSFFLLSVI